MSTPFRDMMSGFTPLPNEIIDHVLPDPTLTGAELKLLLVIIRTTTGWGEEFTTTSYSELRELAGIGNASTISKALRSLEKRRLIVFTAGTTSRDPSVVGLNKDWDPDIDYEALDDGEDDTTPESGPVQLSDRVHADTTPISGQASFNKKKDIKETRRSYPKPAPKPKKRPQYTAVQTHPPVEKSGMYDADPVIMALADKFVEMTGLFYTPGNWDDKWDRPLRALLGIAGGTPEAEKLMKKSIDVLREKRYTVASPASIMVAASNVANAPEEKKETLNR